MVLKDNKTKVSKKIEYKSLSSIFYEESTIISLGVIGFKNKIIKNHIDYFYFSFFQRKEAEKLYSVLENYVMDYKKRRKLTEKIQEEKIKPISNSKNEVSSKILKTSHEIEQQILNEHIIIESVKTSSIETMNTQKEASTDMEKNLNVERQYIDTPYSARITVSINKPVKSKFASSVVLKSIYDEFVALDLETTGLDPERDKIIEISLIKFKDGKPTDSINTLINPKRKIPKKITELTGITNEMIEYEDTIEDILDTIMDFISDYPIIGHNVMFDIQFIRNACRKYYEDDNYYIENMVIDTVKLSKTMFSDLPNYKLSTVLKHINYSVSEHHRSYADALGAAQIYLKYCDFYNQKLIEKQKEFSQDELRCYEIVKEILLKSNKSINYLKYARVGSYIDIQNFSSILRIKLKGKKNYVLTGLDKKIIDAYRTQFTIENAPKSETGDFRIFISSPEDIYRLENLILESFNQSEQDIKYYRVNVLSAERKLQEYLMSV